MDALNEEFAKLEFLGGFPPCSSVYGSKSSDGGAVENSALTNNVQHCRVSIIKDSHTGHYNTNPSGLSPKKAGPTVPPKPQKNVKLQETDGAHYNYGHMIQYSSLCSHPRLLHRKQSTLGSKASCNKMKEFTLDNPAILDQQLEALAHHKMQLEKKGILQKSPVALSACRDPSSHLDALKVSLSSLPSHPKNNSSNGRLKTTAPCPDSSNILLSNPCTASHLTKKTIIKTADETKNGTVSNMYHNTNCENDRLENFASPLTTLNIGTEECLKNIDGTIPPSPVSSSYSELHRATDIFSKISALTTPQKQEVCHNSNNHLITGAKASNLSYSKFNETPSERNCDVPNSVVYQNYMSMNYNNEYVNFNDSSSSQSISQGSSDYYGYGSCSQGSSTYESIYEPITPRPSSQLSARSNYLMYVQYANSPQTSNSGIVDSSGNLSSWTAAGGTEKTKLSAGLNSGSSMKHHISKEPEMEALTDCLVHSVDSANDVYSYGVCVKCNERVVGEKSGCTAMGQVYHISCFTCSQCQVNLQGKPFYALECKPYCEYDYLQTLEKCSICTKPILERILRATGKPYHPQCFTCVVCGNSLDGIPFTVDATNQNYCIADFHKKFAPRCCVCEQPIMPEPGQEETVRVVALDRSFHFDCYKCEDCGLLLSSEAEGRGCYPLDDHVLCKSCNAKRVQLLTNRMTTKL